jgi:hypothetical protein
MHIYAYYVRVCGESREDALLCIYINTMCVCGGGGERSLSSSTLHLSVSLASFKGLRLHL